MVTDKDYWEGIKGEVLETVFFPISINLGELASRLSYDLDELKSSLL